MGQSIDRGQPESFGGCFTMNRYKVHLHSEQFDGFLHAACGAVDIAGPSPRVVGEDDFEKTHRKNRCRKCVKDMWPSGGEPLGPGEKALRHYLISWTNWDNDYSSLIICAVSKAQARRLIKEAYPSSRCYKVEELKG
jgi:hypothetical protein